MRYESVVVRLLATATFLIQMTMYMGVILFAPALALEAMVDFPIEYAMTGVGLCAAFYTAIVRHFSFLRSKSFISIPLEI